MRAVPSSGAGSFVVVRAAQVALRQLEGADLACPATLGAAGRA